MMEVKTRVNSETHKCGGLNYIRKEIYNHQVSSLSSERNALKHSNRCFEKGVLKHSIMFAFSDENLMFDRDKI